MCINQSLCHACFTIAASLKLLTGWPRRSRVKERRAAASPKPPTASTPPAKSIAKATIAATVEARRAELDEARAGLGLASAPLKVLQVVVTASGTFLTTTVASLATGRTAMLTYATAATITASAYAAPELYAQPTCRNGDMSGGPFYPVALFASDFLWWLVCVPTVHAIFPSCWSTQ